MTPAPRPTAAAGSAKTQTVAAVDLGATSGRVIVGRVGPGELSLRHVARFGNEPVRVADGLHWNILELYRNVLAGLARAEHDDPGAVSSVGIDSWAVDYGLLRRGRLLSAPYHYRDERRCADGVAPVHDAITPEELYGRTGLQHLPFTTIYQLATEDGLLSAADRLLLIPDLLAYWLTGAVVAERTNASTTGLLGAATRSWDTGLASRAGIPPGLLPPLIDPGTVVGSTVPSVSEEVGRSLRVTAVGSHDTASAVVAVPNPGRDFAYISCGTWGLAGLELDQPVLTDGAREANFTNEGGVDGRVRFLRNVMGLWLLSESIRTWDRQATSSQRSSELEQLLDAAAQVPGPVPVFDVDDPRFLTPGDIPARIDAWFASRGERGPGTKPEYVRSIVESLAQAFASTVADAARLAGHRVSVIHLVGGGAQNALLCQATADRSGLPVLAGPVEATAIGNILVQARAQGAITGGLESLRSLVSVTFSPTRYLPTGA
ncbi:MAG TPA: rhamnulokinase family protein [Trebonia sp.]